MDKNVDILGEVRQDAFYRYNGIKAPASPRTYDVDSLPRKKIEEEEKPSLYDTGIAAIKKVNLEYAIGKAVVRDSRFVLDADDDFIIDDDIQADIDLNYNKKESKILSKASSRSDFIARKEEIEDERETSMVLGKAGMTGFVAQLGAGLFDPASWLSAGAASTAISATRLAGISRVAAVAASSGVENAAFAYAVQDSQSTKADIAIAFGLGAGIGGSLAGMGNIRKAIKNNNPIERAARRDAENLVARDVEDAIPANSTAAAKAFPEGDLRGTELKLYKYSKSLTNDLISTKVARKLKSKLGKLKDKVAKRTKVAKAAKDTELAAIKTLTAPYTPKLKAAISKLKALEAKTKGIPKKKRFSHQADIAEVKGEIKAIEADIKKVEDSIKATSTGTKAKAIKELTDTVEDSPLNKLVQRRDAIAEKIAKAKSASVKYQEWNKLNKVERMALVEPDGPKDLASSTKDYMKKVDDLDSSMEPIPNSVGADIASTTYAMTKGAANKIRAWAKVGAGLNKDLIGSLPKGRMANAIYSVTTRLTNSDNLAIRGIASALLESPQKGALAKDSAAVNFTLNKRLIHAAQEGKLQEGFDLRLKVLKAQGNGIPKYKFGKISEARSNFNNEVMLELQKPGSTTSHPVLHAAEGLRNQFKVGGGMMQETRVRGAERITDKPYVPVLINKNNIVEGIAVYGEKDMTDMLSHAYGSKLSGLPEAADIMSAIQISKAKGRVLTMDSILNKGKTVDESIKELRAIASKDMGSFGAIKDPVLKKETLDTLFDEIKKYIGGDFYAGEKAVTPRLRKFFEMDISSVYNGKLGEMKIIDFLDNNLDKLSESYTREAAANAAMAKAGFKSRLEFSETLNNVEKVHRNTHSTPEETANLIEDITMLREMEKRIYGEPIDNLSSTTRMNLHDLQRVVALRDLVASGLSQIPEASLLIVKRSWASLWDSMSMKELFYPQSVREGGKKFGKHRRADFAELDEYFGFPGEDHILFNKKFEMDSLDELATSLIRRGSQRVLDSMSRFGPIASGMKHIQGALDKSVLRAVSATMKKMAHSKGYKRKLSKSDLDRAGWSREFFEEEVIPWMKANRNQVSFNGRKLDTMNFSKMATDQPAMFKQVQVGIQRIAQGDIQRSFLGELPRFMNTTAGSVVTQHRSFVIGSYEKQLLHGFKKEPIVALSIIGTGTLLAHLSNLGKVAYRELGKEDFEEKWEEAIDIENPRTVMNAILNTGQLSSLGIFKDVMETVGAVDPVLSMMGTDTTSNDLGFRSLGSQSVPAAGYVRDVVNVPKSVFQAIDPGNEKGGKDILKAVHRVLPVANMIGINQILNYVEAE